MAQISTRKCEVCEKDTGKWFCYECRHFLCQSCKHYHDKFQKKHTVTDSHNVDRLALSKQLNCEEHKEDFVLFCLQCDCLTCNSCVTTTHRGHSLTQISEVVSQARENVKANIGQLKKKIETLTDLIERIKATKLKKIKDESKLFASEVEKTSEHIISIVNCVKEIDITRASDFLVLEKQQLEFGIAKLEKVYKEHASISSQLEQVLQLKHDIAFFLNQRSITMQIGDLDDIPRVEEPNEIGKFNKEDFAKAVVKEIQSQYNIGDEDVGTEILKCTTQNKEPYGGETHDSYVSRRYCAAIDIGSTYSGYAFSSKDDYEKEPTKVNTNAWAGSKLMSYKAPTAVLFNNSQEFIAFGSEAENTYSEFVAEGEHADYYYFEQFKMLLHDKRITMDMKIKDERGREMEALTVFQHCITYLKDHLFKSISDKVPVQDYDLHYVLTVPTIWCNSAIQFMEAAALKAGISYGQLSITLEPDAAIMYCQHLKTERRGPMKNIVTYTEGMKYMVIDLGGGTADITCHQVSRDGTLKECAPPSGGPCGGSSIDEAFWSFMKRICGPKVIDELCTVELEDYIDLFREFETKKRSIKVNQTNKVIITLPIALLDLVKKRRGKKMETILEQSQYGQSVSYSKQKLHLQPDTFRDLFKATGDALVKHLDRMFEDEKLSDLNTVLMVGGLSECEIMQHRIKERFGNDRKIIIPEEAGLAVLKGAVLLGHQGRRSRRVLRPSHVRHTVLA